MYIYVHAYTYLTSIYIYIYKRFILFYLILIFFSMSCNVISMLLYFETVLGMCWGWVGNDFVCSAICCELLLLRPCTASLDFFNLTLRLYSHFYVLFHLGTAIIYDRLFNENINAEWPATRTSQKQSEVLSLLSAKQAWQFVWAAQVESGDSVTSPGNSAPAPEIIQ